MPINPNPSSELPRLNLSVRNLASQCVKCGLCLPHCPTYQLSEDENESPRGRIELLKAIAEKNLAPSPQVKQHLDQCLTCRACERVCPAKVEYGKLITSGRTLLATESTQRQKNYFMHHLFEYLVFHPKRLNGLHKLLWLLEVSKIRKMANFLKIPQLIGLGTLNQFLPPVAKPIALQTYYPAKNIRVGSVGLFLGCFQKLADVDVYQASIQVLTSLGFDVHVPKQQTCCGAISLHAGKSTQSQTLMQQNLEAFAEKDLEKIDYIVSLATGCGTILKDYPNYTNADIGPVDAYQSFAKKIVDISTLILNTTWPANLKLKNIKKNIAVHSPCTHKNVWRSENHPIELLKKIPQTKITPIETQTCCGAAGTYMFDFPSISESLVMKIVREVQSKKIDIVTTSNIGCALNLKQIFNKEGINIDVQHPISVLSKAIFF